MTERLKFLGRGVWLRVLLAAGVISAWVPVRGFTQELSLDMPSFHEEAEDEVVDEITQEIAEELTPPEPKNEAEIYDIAWEKRSREYVNFVLNPNDCRWNAEIINVSGTEVMETGPDYASSRHGDAWDFDEGDYEGIDEFGGIPAKETLDSEMMEDVLTSILEDDGAELDLEPTKEEKAAQSRKGGRRVENGSLCFTTGDGAYFFWGNHLGKNKDYGEEEINANLLRIRVRQTEPVSSWTVEMRGTGATRTGATSKKFVLEGTEWQTKEIPLPGGRRTSICFRPGHKGNFIEIDKIELVSRSLTKYFRKVVDISEEVREATFYAKSDGGYTITVNGEQAYTPIGGRYSAHRLDAPADLTPFLKKGKNVIAVRSGTHLGSDYQSRQTRHFMMEGIVLFKSGRFKRVFTDSSWKASYTADEGWNALAFDDSAWANADSRGKITSPGAYQWVPGGRRFYHAPYMGPIALDYPGRSSAIYGMGESASFRVTLPKRTFTDKAYDLSYRIDYVTGEFDQKEVASGKLADFKTEGLDQVYAFQYPAEKAGVYELHLALADENGAAIDDRMEEFVIAGKIDQAEIAGEDLKEGLDLELVDHIDCTTEESKERFTTAGSYDPNDTKEIGSEIVEKEFGTYRQLKTDQGWSRFIFNLEIKNPENAHLVEIEYPDDQRRSMIAWVSEYAITEARATHIIYWRSSSAMKSGGAYTPTDSMQTMNVLYWPRKRNAVVDLYNPDPGTRAAVAHVRVYEIKNGLPSVRVASAVAGRHVGGQAERDTTLLNNFYQGHLGTRFQEMCFAPRRRFYYDWYCTIENMIKYLRFSGENVFMTGAYMYEKVLYPTWKYGNGRIFEKDYRDLMAKMFEYNGIDMLLGVQFAFTRPFYREDRYGDEDVRQGSPTIRLVSKDGEQAYNGLTKAGLNWFHPEVEKVALDMLSELMQTYDEYPAVKGLALYTAQSMYPCLCIQTRSKPRGPSSGLDFGYGDATIARFEKETGVKIPVPAEGRDRFQKRYDWLTQNAMDKWLDWRCGTMNNQFLKIAGKMRELRPDWTLHMIGIAPMFDDRKNWQAGKRTYREACRERGVDPQLYNPVKDILGYTSLVQADDWKKSSINLDDEGLSDELVNVYGPHPIGEYLSRNVAPHGFGRVPGSRYASAEPAKALSFLTPSLMIHGKADVIYMQGGEQNLRRFNRAFRTLPDGEYSDIGIEGVPDRIFVRESTQAQQKWFYVVNMRTQDASVSIALEAKNGSELWNPVTDEKTALSGGKTVSAEIAPCQMKVYRVNDPGAVVKSVTVQGE